MKWPPSARRASTVTCSSPSPSNRSSPASHRARPRATILRKANPRIGVLVVVFIPAAVERRALAAAGRRLARGHRNRRAVRFRPRETAAVQPAGGGVGGAVPGNGGAMASQSRTRRYHASRWPQYLLLERIT